MPLYKGYVSWNDKDPESGEISNNEYAREGDDWEEILNYLWGYVTDRDSTIIQLSVELAKK